VLGAIIAFLIFLLVGIIFGTVKSPTRDDLMLIASSFVLLVIAWFYKKEKLNDKDKIK